MANWKRLKISARQGASISVLMVVAIATAISAITSVASATIPHQEPSGYHPTTAGLAGRNAPNIGVRLLDVPLDTVDDPRARQYIVDNLKPGTTIHRRIEISNNSAAGLHVAVYAGGATIAHGSFIGAAANSVDELSSWTTFSQNNIAISGGAKVRDIVTVTIPKDASPGERYAVVWVEVGDAHNGSIALVNRVGIRMYLSVGGNNPPPTNFTVDTMTAQRGPNGFPIVQAQVHNTGGRALDLSGTLRLSEVSGSLSAGPYQVQLGTTLAPGQSEPVKVVLTDQLVDGPWNATINLESGLVHETYEARIIFPRGSGSSPPVAAHPTPTNGLGGWLAGRTLAGVASAVVVLGVIVLLVLAYRRRKRQRAQPRPSTS